MSGWGALLALAVVVNAHEAHAKPPASKPVAQKKVSAPKPVAHKVVVLDFEGDRKGKVRAQLESALRKVRAVQVVSLKQYTASAAKERLKGPAAQTPESLKVVAPKLGLDAAVTGTVGGAVRIRLLDASGNELLSREVPLQKGLMATADARQLAEDLASATAMPVPPEPVPEESKLAPVVPPAPEVAPQTAPAAPAPKAEPPVAQAEPPSTPIPAPAEEAHAATEPPPPSTPPAVSRKAHPPIVRVFLGGSTTWRKYCARPGVSKCADFDAKPPEEQNGDTQSFSTSVPYLGVGLEVELLPLARQDSLLRGLGVVLGAQLGFSDTTVRVSTPSGNTPDTKVSATDTTLTALAMYRYYFERHSGETPLLGYVGLRGGVMGRAFDVDESALSPLSGTHRLAPVVGLEVSVPLLKPLRIEGAGHFFFQPKPGTWIQHKSALDLELLDYGQSVSSTGWNAELGLAGDVWGPLGYSVRFKLTHFQDTFTGTGARTGWTAGGVAEETYATVNWGLTASW